MRKLAIKVLTAVLTRLRPRPSRKRVRYSEMHAEARGNAGFAALWADVLARHDAGRTAPPSLRGA